MTNSPDSPPHTVQPTQPMLPDGSGAVSLSTAIVRHVAAEKDMAPTDLKPLYEVIDSDALELLFDPAMDGMSRTSGRVVFEYSGCQVIVTGTGDIQTTLLDGP